VGSFPELVSTGMRRFFWIWLTLLGAFWAARTLLSAAAFQRVERGPGPFFQLVVVPAAQAVLVWWITRERRTAPRQVLRALLTPWLAFLLAWDAVVVEVDWLGGWRLAGWNNALQSLAAGAMVAGSAVRGKWTRRERIWLGLFAAWLPAAGAGFLIPGLHPWLAELPERLVPSLPAGSGAAAVDGVLFILSVGLVLRVQVVWRSRAAAPALLLDLAVGFGLAGAAIVVLDAVLHPDLPAPWGPLVHACAAWAMTCLLCGAWKAFRPTWTGRPAPGRRGPPPASGSPSLPAPRSARPHSGESAS